MIARLQVILRRDAYDTAPDAFMAEWQPRDMALRQTILTAPAATAAT